MKSRMTIPEYMMHVSVYYGQLIESLQQLESLSHIEFMAIYQQLQEDKTYLTPQQYQLLRNELYRVCYSDCLIYNV